MILGRADRGQLYPYVPGVFPGKNNTAVVCPHCGTIRYWQPDRRATMRKSG